VIQKKLPLEKVQFLDNRNGKSSLVAKEITDISNAINFWKYRGRGYI